MASKAWSLSEGWGRRVCSSVTAFAQGGNCRQFSLLRGSVKQCIQRSVGESHSPHLSQGKAVDPWGFEISFPTNCMQKAPHPNPLLKRVGAKEPMIQTNVK